MRCPSLPGFRLDVSEAGARRRIRDADEVMARRAFNLPAGELRFALQRLVAMRAIKLEFICVHSLHPHYAQTGDEKYMELFILLVRAMRR